MLNQIKSITKTILNIAGVSFLWISLHFIAANLYPYLCAPLSFWGFLSAPFLIETPWCVSLRWTINAGSGYITSMWLAIGTWLCSKLIKKRTNNHDGN